FLETEGPNTSISGNFLFTTFILPDNTLLIIDGNLRQISRVNVDGKRVQFIKIPLENDFDYIPQVGDGVDGMLFENKFYFPVYPFGFLAESYKDKRLKNLNHFAIYEINNNSVKMGVKRDYYYSQDSIFNLYPTCLTNFFAQQYNLALKGDCYNEVVDIFNLKTGLKESSFDMKSDYFSNVPPYPKHYTETELRVAPTFEIKDIVEYGHIKPSYRQIFIDTMHQMVIRQAKFGLSDEEHSEDRTKWAHSYILADLHSFEKIGEVIIKRGNNYDINFLKGFMTSEGLYFPFKEIQEFDEDYLHFVKVNFIEE
ncbi:MAG: hypothetical protein ACMG6E_04615, partial [Candidatus Roizmanbacteria bacterium]